MDIENYFERQMPEMTDLLEQLVNMDSNSFDKEDVDQINRILTEKFEEIGMFVEVHREKEYGNHLEIKAEEGSDPGILIVAHTDTVFKKGTAKDRPYEEIGDRAYGPGISDEKASHVAVLYVLKFLKENEPDAYKNVHLIFNSDEEIGSRTSRALIKEAAKGKDYGLVVESGRPDDAVVSERKGVGHFTLHVQGEAAHAGVEPERGKNAIDELAHKVVELQDLNNQEEGLSVNVGLISGGLSRNTIPPEAEAEVDVRVVNLEQGKKVERDIAEIAEKEEIHGTTTTLKGSIGRPPMEKTAETEKLLDIIKEVGKELGMTVKDVSTGGGSDAAYIAAEGVPTIDGMGPLGEFSHSFTDEYVDLKTFPKRAALLANTIKRLTEKKRS